MRSDLGAVRAALVVLVASLVAGLVACNALTGASKVEIVDCVGPCDDAGGGGDSARDDTSGFDSRPNDTAGLKDVAADSGADTADGADAADGAPGETSPVDSAGDGDSGDGGPLDAPSETGAPGATSLALGDKHTCVVLADGSAECWGSNAFGQLGDGTTADRSAPARVAGISGAAQLSLGRGHTCARLTGGSVQCWGSNTNGQLGFVAADACTVAGTTTPCSESAKPVPGLGGATQLALGGNGSLALDGAGAVQYWGQIGPFTSGSPAPYSGTDVATQIAQGGSHACYLVGGGASTTLKCWGDNFDGELGRADLASHDLGVVSGLSVAVAKISLGGAHSCVVFTDGGVDCWGSNVSGQLGYASTDTCGGRSCNLAPRYVDIGGSASEVAAGGAHTCALLTSGVVKCWGANANGQVGIGGGGTVATPIAVAIGKVVHIAAGGAHTCALLESGALECWGSNDKGQIGDSTFADALAPTPIAY